VCSTRGAVAYNGLGDVVWPTSSLVVIYSRATHAQRFFRGHKAEVSAVSVSRCGRYVASGERGNRPLTMVWDAQTGAELASLGPFHRHSVASIAWSPDSRRVVSVGGDLEHSVALWVSESGGWDDARRLAYSCGDHQAVAFACFLDPEHWAAGKPCAPMQPTGVEGPRHPGYFMATGGTDHVKFWSLEGRTLTPERGLWGPDAKAFDSNDPPLVLPHPLSNSFFFFKRAIHFPLTRPSCPCGCVILPSCFCPPPARKVQPMLCGCTLGPRLFTGGVSGHIYIWRGRNCEKVHSSLFSTPPTITNPP